MNKKIYLASSSPRRKELLSQIIEENNFSIIPSDYEEDNSLKMKPEELVSFHALKKAQSAKKLNNLENGIIISADTIVALGNEILGKPHTAENNKLYLQKISGREIKAITGYAIIDCKRGKELSNYCITKVVLDSISDELIEKYVATQEGLDKAGGMTIQEKGAIFVKSIDGCYFNVVGLPIYQLFKDLEEFGFQVL